MTETAPTKTLAVPAPRTVVPRLIEVGKEPEKQLSLEQAQHLTDTIRNTSEALYWLLERAHAGRAWVPLHYSGFGEYLEAEFSMSRSRGYQLLDFARVASALKGLLPEGVDLPKELNEATARKLKPHLAEVTEYVRVESGGLANVAAVHSTITRVLDVARHPDAHRANMIPGLHGLQRAVGGNAGYTDVWHTPRAAIAALEPFLPRNSRVWCPFDNEHTGSHIVDVLRENGHAVTATHIAQPGGDFFSIRGARVPDATVAVSNPPFSMRNAVIERLREHDIPWAMLLSEQGLFDGPRFDLLAENGHEIEMLILDRRVQFQQDYDGPANAGVPFKSVWLCSRVLPQQLTFARLYS